MVVITRSCGDGLIHPNTILSHHQHNPSHWQALGTPIVELWCYFLFRFANTAVIDIDYECPIIKPMWSDLAHAWIASTLSWRLAPSLGAR